MINSTDLRKHALSTVAFGYSKRQTDAVLNLAADTIDRMAAEIIHLNRLLADLDGVIAAPDHETPGVLEIKTASRRTTGGSTNERMQA